MHTRGPRRQPLHTFLRGSETPGPALSAIGGLHPQAAGGGAARAGPGRYCARAGGSGCARAVPL